MKAETQSNRKPLLTETQAADVLAISRRKLWSLRVSGNIPHVHIDRLVRYDPEDLLEWIEHCKAVTSK